MAENSTKIVLTAEDRTTPALQSVTRGLQGMQAQADLAGRALGALGVTFSAAAAVAFVKGTIDAADGMNDLTQKVGIGIRQLAGWTLAANQSGTSMESVAKGIKGLSAYLVEHGDKLRAAGITATDANGAMIQLADLFEAMPDGVEKTALAVQIFGKAGMDMIPMLNMGSKGMAEAQEKAAEYGQRMAELAPHADRFNDLLAEMAFQSKVTGINIGVELVPPMIKFLEQLQEGKKIAGGWLSAMWEFGVVLDPTKGIPENLKRTREELEKLNAEMARGMKENQQNGGLNDLSDIERGIGSASRRKQFLEFMQRQQAMENAAKFGDYRDARDLSLTTGSTMARARGLLDKNSKAGAGRTAKASRFDPFGDFEQKFADMNEKAKRAGFDAADKEAEALEKRRIAMEQMAEKRMEDTRIATEGEEAIREAMEKTSRSMEKQSDIARDLGMTFSSAFEDAIVGGKGLSDVLGGLAQDIQRIVVRKSITEPIGAGLSKMLDKGFDSFFGGARASGGPVDAGRAYLVGEEGPELFIPSAAGGIVPTPALAATGGGGQSFSFQIDARGAEIGVERRIQAAVMQAVKLAVAAVPQQADRGGSYARSLGRR